MCWILLRRRLPLSLVFRYVHHLCPLRHTYHRIEQFQRGKERDTYAHIECLSMDNTSLVELISSFAPLYIDQRSGERNDDGITSLAERRELLISSSFSAFDWRNKLHWSIWIVKWFLYRRRRLLRLRLHRFVHHLIRVNGRRSVFFVRVTCYNRCRNTCLPRYPKLFSRQPRRRRRATPPPLMRRKQRH